LDNWSKEKLKIAYRERIVVLKGMIRALMKKYPEL